MLLVVDRRCEAALMADGTRRLVILRHAKAATAPGLKDIERPLKERGERDAVAAGRWLRTADLIPDLVVCSTSRRTRQTWEHVAGELPAAPSRVCFESRVYDNDVEELIEVLRAIGREVRTVLLIGHNPSAHELLVTLTGEPGGEPGFPTGAIAVVELQGGWDAIRPGVGRLTGSWHPVRRRR